MHWNCEHFHFLPFLPSPSHPLFFLKGLLETLYYVRSTTYSFVLRSIANKPVKRREMLKLYLGAVGKMAWKLLLFYLDKLTLSELQIQGPLWPFIMKKSISTLSTCFSQFRYFGQNHLITYAKVFLTLKRFSWIVGVSSKNFESCQTKFSQNVSVVHYKWNFYKFFWKKKQSVKSSKFQTGCATPIC